MPKWDDAQISAVLDGRLKLRRKFIPALKCDVAFRLLSEGDTDACKLEAQRYAKKMNADIDLDPEFLEREIERQIVWRSTFDADTMEAEFPEPFFPSDKDLRKVDTVLLRSLSNAYLEVQAEANPLNSLSEEQVDALVEQLGKDQSVPVLLKDCAPDTLALFVRSMARRLRAT